MGSSLPFLAEPQDIVQLKAAYRTEAVKKSYKSCIIASFFGILISSYYAFQDVYLVGLENTIPWRMLLFFPCLIFLLFGRALRARHPSAIFSFHAIILAAGVCMMFGINAEVFVNQPEFRYRVMSGTIALAFGAYLVSSVLRRYLGIIILVPTVVLLIYLFGYIGLNIGEMTYFPNLIVLCILISISAYFHDRLARREFYMRKLAQIKIQTLKNEIIRRKAIEKKLEKDATTDPLTGLLNRRAGYEKLNWSIKFSKRSLLPFVLCYIDLDNLKKTNDTLGHQYGDEMIKAFCSVVTDNIRGIDVFSRMGGDEFIVIFQAITEPKARHIVNRILEHLCNRPQIPKIGFSFGLVQLDPDTNMSTDQALKLADSRMYKHKEKNRTKTVETALN